MPDFTVTLIHRAIVCGSITVEAEDFDAARSAALSRADEASWPVDETGSVVRPSDQQAAVVADYARNDTTREEVYFNEALPTSAAPPVPSDAPVPDYEAIARAAGWSEGTTKHGEPCFIATGEPDVGLISGAQAGDWKNLCERERLVPISAPADPVKAEMLAALKTARRWADAYAYSLERGQNETDAKRVRADVAAADAAIARAEGRA